MNNVKKIGDSLVLELLQRGLKHPALAAFAAKFYGEGNKVDFSSVEEIMEIVSAFKAIGAPITVTVNELNKKSLKQEKLNKRIAAELEQGGDLRNIKAWDNIMFNGTKESDSCAFFYEDSLNCFLFRIPVKLEYSKKDNKEYFVNYMRFRFGGNKKGASVFRTVNDLKASLAELKATDFVDYLFSEEVQTDISTLTQKVNTERFIPETAEEIIKSVTENESTIMEKIAAEMEKIEEEKLEMDPVIIGVYEEFEQQFAELQEPIELEDFQQEVFARLDSDEINEDNIRDIAFSLVSLLE